MMAADLCAQALDTPTQQRSMKEIRIEWHLHGFSSGGCWFPDTPRNRELLKTNARLLCMRHGTATHWVAERQA